MPLISMVMPSYNQAPWLETAIRSILEQTDVDLELIILDPGSTDGSREILARLHEETPDRIRLVLEPDPGQSAALNRGFAMAEGEIMGWLNSDDRLLPGALARAAQALADKPEPAWVYGRAKIIDEAGRPTARLVETYKSWRGRRFTRCKLLTENFIPQMATFWNRAMWEAAGGLDDDLHLDMDYDLWLRFAAVADPRVLREELAAFRVHQAAKGSVTTAAQLRAARITARRYAGKLGWKGKLSLIIHRILAARTRLLYTWMKPR